MARRRMLLIGMSACLGVLLVWGCISLLGILAAFVSEHRFFGLPVYPVMVAETVLAWIPLNCLAGILLGLFLRKQAVYVCFLATAFGFLFLVLTSFDLWWTNESVLKSAATFAFIFGEVGILMLTALSCGALLAIRYARSNFLFQPTAFDGP